MRLQSETDQYNPQNFNSRTSCEVRHLRHSRWASPEDFNSRTSCEVRLPSLRYIAVALDFNSRTSCEVRQGVSTGQVQRHDFNSRTSCEVRLLLPAFIRAGAISTHAPLARCDQVFSHSLIMPSAHFNSRTSCEVRLRPCRTPGSSPGFQLTHLLRGATTRHWWWTGILTFQLTHLLRGATPSSSWAGASGLISTHAPLARCDKIQIIEI